MILSAQGITKSFSDEKILDNVSIQINDREKYAICASNGRGKSTLIKILIGEIEADAGSVYINKDIKIGYLAQYSDYINSELSVLKAVINERQDLIELEERLLELEQNMTDKEDILVHEKLIKEYEDNGGLVYKSLAESILNGLGFDNDDLDKTISMLSGGEKARVDLAKLLIGNNDLLILDEPINHLDLSAIIWLEDYLKSINIPLIIVAHDRYFLDKTVDHILDLNTSPAFVYNGNYSQFIRQKEVYLTTNEREVNKQASNIRHQKEVISKLQSFNREKSIKRANSRLKALDKLDEVHLIKDNISHIELFFNTSVRSGDDVLSIDQLSCVYDDSKIFENVSFELKRKDKVSLFGDNGTGKSTILKMITGLQKPTGGSIKIGSNVIIGYYDQAQMNLTDSNTIFDEIHNMYPEMNNTNIRNALAKLGFIDDDVYKAIKKLSGGEKAKVSLCKLMLSDCNLLILDEPTNHLDMESKAILEKALNAYEGTLLFVSHDRYFINQVADKLIELTDNGINEYIGNYDYYIEKKKSVLNQYESTKKRKVMNQLDSKDDWIKQKERSSMLGKLKRELSSIENEIECLEDELESFDELLSDPVNATNSYKLNELTTNKDKVENNLNILYDKWEEVSLNISSLE